MVILPSSLPYAQDFPGRRVTDAEAAALPSSKKGWSITASTLSLSGLKASVLFCGVGSQLAPGLNHLRAIERLAKLYKTSLSQKHNTDRFPVPMLGPYYQRAQLVVSGLAPTNRIFFRDPSVLWCAEWKKTPFIGLWNYTSLSPSSLTGILILFTNVFLGLSYIERLLK